MFIDWLTVSQVHSHDLPVVCDVLTITVDANTGQKISEKQPRFKHQGSYSTTITIHVTGRKVRVEGNPSRINRLDNLWGYSRIQDCIAVYNAILAEYGLPPFTKCTKVFSTQQVSQQSYVDGACLHRIDLTTNVGVGEGNVLAYLRALSSQRIGHSIGHLYPNGRTVDWRTEKGGCRLQYRKAYDKAYELDQHLIPRILRTFGEDSPEFLYAKSLREYCVFNGVVRMEQELKNEFLQAERLRYWGLFDENRLNEIHLEFLATDERLKVTAMDLASISEQLIAENIVKSTYAANTTAMYAIQWMDGQVFDFKKSSVKTHAARLNRIGINIRNACDTSRFVPVFIRQAREVTKTYHLPVPDWYQRPVSHLRLVA